MTGESIAEVAAGLTKAQRQTLLDWYRPVMIAAVTRRAFDRLGITTPDVTDQLTSYGLAVRTHLISQGADHDR